MSSNINFHQATQVAIFSATVGYVNPSGFFSTIAAVTLGAGTVFAYNIFSVAKKQFFQMKNSEPYKTAQAPILNVNSEDFNKAFAQLGTDTFNVKRMKEKKIPLLQPNPTDEDICNWFKNKISKNGASYGQYALLAEKPNFSKETIEKLPVQEIFFREMVHLANPTEVDRMDFTREFSSEVEQDVYERLIDKRIKNKVGAIVSSDHAITFQCASENSYFIYDSHPTVGGLFQFNNRKEFFAQLKNRAPSHELVRLETKAY